MKYLAIIAFVGFFAIQSVHSAPEKIDCSKVTEALDDLGGAQGLTTLNPKYKPWTSAEELTKRCSEMRDAILMLKKYNKECFSSLTQQVFSAILRTRTQMHEASCKPDTPEFKGAVEASKCIQEHALEAVKDAEKKTILASQVLLDANVPDDKLRLRRACCSVLSSKTNFLDATKANCAAYENVYNNYVDSYTSEAMGIICPDADKLECNKLEVLKTEGVELKYHFFLNPMIKLVKTLDH